jgi:hypothetical protein
MDAELPPYVSTAGTSTNTGTGTDTVWEDGGRRRPEEEEGESAEEVDLKDLYSVIGEDFYVTTPLWRVRRHTSSDAQALAPKGLYEYACEGTRLTVQAREPDGFEFTIRTPGMPSR